MKKASKTATRGAPRSDEAARLEKLRTTVPDFIDSRKNGPFERLYKNKRDAVAAFEKAKGGFWGHDTWQSTQPFTGRVLAALKMKGKGGNERAVGRLREIGYYWEGGSIEGHTSALYGLLGRYDRLEDFPACPSDPAALDDDLAARLAARNQLLRPKVQGTFELRLALLAGVTPRAQLYKGDTIDHAVAGEAALRAKDYDEAAKRFAKIVSNKPSWMTDMSRGDPRVVGYVGLARVAHSRGIHALVIKHVEAALALDNTNAPALLLGMTAADVLGLRPRATGYRARLRRAHPWDDVQVDGLCRAEVEARLGALTTEFVAHRTATKAWRQRDWQGVVAAAPSIFGTGKKPPLDGSKRDLAAAFLYGLAMTGDPRRTKLEAERFLRADPAFVTAREALAFALGRLGKSGEGHYAKTGLSALFGPDNRMAYRAWSKLSAPDALAPFPVMAVDRAEALFMQGATDEGLAVLSARSERRRRHEGARSERSERRRRHEGGLTLDKHAPIRWLAAGSRFRQATLRSPAEQKKAAKDAWAMIAPLTRGLGERHHLGVQAMVAGIEIATALGDPKLVLGVEIPYEATNYRALTDRAHARVAPLIADAMIALGRPKKAIAMITRIFVDDESERQNARLIDALDRAETALRTIKLRGPKTALRAKGKPVWSDKVSAEDRAAAHTFGDEDLHRLSDEAWAHDQRGDVEKAIAAYLAAAEGSSSRSSIGLGNAGNLLTRRRDYPRAWRFLAAALANLSGFSDPTSRAPVLAQVAHWYREQGRHADALPSAALAFELGPSAERAALLAIDYLALGFRSRAEAACAKGEELEPRRPEVRRARAAITNAPSKKCPSDSEHKHDQ